MSTHPRVAISGAAGQMGQLLLAGTIRASDLTLSAALDRGDHPDQGKDAGSLCGLWPTSVPLGVLSPLTLSDTDVVVDFSLPAGTRELLGAAGGQALVIGVTGLDQDLTDALHAYAKRAPVLIATNFSTGVNVLLGLVEQAAGILSDYDLEIVEMHHNRKRDAPSGTACSLAEAGARGRGVDLVGRTVHGRHGEPGPRSQGEIGLHAVRGGDIAGEHTVYLAGSGERLALTHLATSRAAFADGALRAARWVHGKPPGLYTMPQVLGFR